MKMSVKMQQHIKEEELNFMVVDCLLFVDSLALPRRGVVFVPLIVEELVV